MNSIVREKLQEQIFGRIAKNLKWLEILLDMALKAVGLKEYKDENDHICQLLLEKIHSGEYSISIAFIPILSSVYPHRYEVGELFGKYAAASYEIAKTAGSTASVTEEFWQETYPDDGLGQYSYSENRIVEILVPKNEETTEDFTFLARHAYVGARNLCANLEQLGLTFKDEPYVASFVGLLATRISQIEESLSSLRRLLIKGSEPTTTEEIPERKARTMENLVALKTGKPIVRSSEKKFVWDAKVVLSNPEVFVSEEPSESSSMQESSPEILNMNESMTFQRGIKGTDTIYVVDSSKSMQETFEKGISKFEKSKSDLIKALSSGTFCAEDRVGIIFANETILSKPVVTETLQLTEISSLVANKNLPEDQIMHMQSWGGTAVQRGISDALSVLVAKRKSNDLNIVVITDNTFRADMKSDKTMNEARKTNVKIHFVVLGDPKNKRNLQIASDMTGGKLFCAGNEYELQSILKAFNTKEVEAEAKTETKKSKSVAAHV